MVGFWWGFGACVGFIIYRRKIKYIFCKLYILQNVNILHFKSVEISPSIQTALHYAIGNKDASMTQLLLSNQADVNTRTNDRATSSWSSLISWVVGKDDSFHEVLIQLLSRAELRVDEVDSRGCCLCLGMVVVLGVGGCCVVVIGVVVVGVGGLLVLLC